MKGTCSYVRPDNGLGGPKHVACGYFVRGCRCVGRMCIFYDKLPLGIILQKFKQNKDTYSMNYWLVISLINQ